MAEFLAIIISFPTVVFTVAVALATLYWGLALVGAVDLEVGDAALEGALDGALDAALDGAIDGAVDGAMDAAADGMADAAADAAADGGAEAATDGAADGVGGGMLVFVANVLRLGRVPVTVIATAFAGWGWLTGFLVTWLHRAYIQDVVPDVVFYGVASAVIVGVATALTHVTVRPLEPVFRSPLARERSSLVGETCEVLTGRVDPRFGQAELQLGGDDLFIQVRCDAPGSLRRGDAALIVHFDPRRDAFVVEPLAAHLPTAPSGGRARISTTQEG